MVSYGLVGTLMVLLVIATFQRVRRPHLPGGIAVVSGVVVVLLMLGTGGLSDPYISPVGKGLAALFIATAVLAVVHAFQFPSRRKQGAEAAESGSR